MPLPLHTPQPSILTPFRFFAAGFPPATRLHFDFSATFIRRHHHASHFIFSRRHCSITPCHRRFFSSRRHARRASFCATSAGGGVKEIMLMAPRCFFASFSDSDGAISLFTFASRCHGLIISRCACLSPAWRCCRHAFAAGITLVALRRLRWPASSAAISYFALICNERQDFSRLSALERSISARQREARHSAVCDGDRHSLTLLISFSRGA